MCYLMVYDIFFDLLLNYDESKTKRTIVQFVQVVCINIISCNFNVPQR
jgi:hypothetical protein